MNDIWSILKIEPTDDKKAIRKAFAAQSKLHHPEEEPEYFAALNQAYKAALDYDAGAEKTADSTGKSASDRMAFGRMASDRISSDRMDSDRTSFGEGSATFVPFEPGGKAGEDRKETLQEKEHEKTEDGDAGHASNNEISLLERLNQASRQAIKQSKETGALREFIGLFENPKQAKQADTWKRFFLSESFLGEQFSEEFAKGLLFYLSEQTLCPRDNLPMYF